MWQHTYISELDHAKFSQLAHAAVGRLRLQKELGQGHLFTSEQLPHGGGQKSPPMTVTHKAGKLLFGHIKFKYGYVDMKKSPEIQNRMHN